MLTPAAVNVPIRGRNQAEQLRRNISAEDRIKYDNESIYLIIDSINEAINAGKKDLLPVLQIRCSEGAEAAQRRKAVDIQPSQAGLERRFLLHGRRIRQQEGRTFRLDRILKRPDILEEDALPFPADFDFEKHLQTSFRMFGTKYTTVDLICSNDLMDAILDKFGKDVTTYCYDMENFRAEVDVVPSSVFYSWVFGFGGDVVINGPADVKEEFKQLVQKVADKLNA
jgi:predicted DNA-binding transcriptional regulator YafY